MNELTTILMFILYFVSGALIGAAIMYVIEKGDDNDDF